MNTFNDCNHIILDLYINHWQLERLRFCHSCEVSAVNLLKQREHIPAIGIGSSLCVTLRL